MSADGVGNLLSGLMGTVPNTTYSTSVSVTALTGVGARGRGHRARDRVHRGGLRSEGARRGARHPRAGRRVLHHRAAGPALRRRHEDRRPGRGGLPQGPDRRRLLLAGGGPAERRDLSRADFGHRRRPAGQRDDGGRAGGDPAHALRRADGAAPTPRPSAVRGRVAAGRSGSSCGPSPPAAAGTRRWPTAWMRRPRRRC